MTSSDQQLIDSYMGWGSPGVNMRRKYDMNDAILCVEKMVERGDWTLFTKYSFGMTDLKLTDVSSIQNLIDSLDKLNADFTAWLFNPDNFFSALAAWLRSK